MPLEAPRLDKRTFEDLLRQARLRIPRYTPEWTDHNDSDPGTTLIQLFAWLTELMLHEMEQVPQLTYVKFLQLLNIELKPAQPARAHLTFGAKVNATRVDAVRARTQALAVPDDGGDPLIFETEQGLDVIPVQLTHVLLFDGTGAPRNVTEQNAQPGPPFPPFGWTPQIGNALCLGFAPGDQRPDRPFPRALRFRVAAPIDGLPPAPVSCRETVATPAPPAGLRWEYKPAQTSVRWEPLALYEDESVAFTRDGYVSIAGPPASIQPSKEFDVPEDRFWIRCRIDGLTYPSGIVPEIDFIRPNTVPAINLATVRDELVAVSQGVPDQTFPLRRRPAMPESLVLTVTVPGELPELWTRQPDFLASGPDDPHYVLNATRGEIRFGNGQRGRVPVAGSEIVAVEYRYGGGRAGNVAAGAIATLLANVTGVDGVTNDRPAFGGADEERPEDLARQAPKFLRCRNRAVTAEDFEALARQAGGVAKATALELFHPDFPGVEVPGAVTVVVVPESPAIEERKPEPSPDLLRSVCRYLDDFRLLTTEVHVKGPDYREVQVQATVEAEPYAAFDAVARDVAEALDEYLDPLGRPVPKRDAEPARPKQTAGNGAETIVVAAGGANRAESGWPFGRDLAPTNLYGVILRIPHVAAVRSLTLKVQGRLHQEVAKPVILPRDGLLCSAGNHEIVVLPKRDV